jgi:hypothetical protein
MSESGEEPPIGGAPDGQVEREPGKSGQRYNVDTTAVELFQLCPGKMSLLAAVVLLAIFALHLLVPGMGGRALLLELAFVGVCVNQLFKWLPASMVGVVVGADGILVRGRFLPYSKIRDVHYYWRRQREKIKGREGQLRVRDSLVFVEMMDGERVKLTRKVTATLRAAIDDARAASAAGPGDPGALEGLSAGGKRSRLEWLRALRNMGSDGAGVYRRASMDSEQLARLVDDSQVRPAARAAAVVVLAESGDRAAAKKLRVAAESLANPRVRVAFDNIAAARDDTAIAEALEALDAADCEERSTLEKKES